MKKVKSKLIQFCLWFLNILNYDWEKRILHVKEITHIYVKKGKIRYRKDFVGNETKLKAPQYKVSASICGWDSFDGVIKAQ